MLAMTIGAGLPAFSLGEVLGQWSLAPVPTIGTVWVVGLYLLGVQRLRARGDHWPVGRTVAFVGGGMGSFYFATASGLAAYDTTLLSVHMVQHMILSMLVRAFRFEVIADREPVPVAHLTVRAKDGIWLRITPRALSAP